MNIVILKHSNDGRQFLFGEKFPLEMVVGRYSLEKWDEAKQEAGESVL